MVYAKAWEVGYARDTSRGVRRYVEATEARTTLQGFLEANVPARAIARASGLSDTAIGNLIQGRRAQVQAATAAKVAALTLAAIYAHATGTDTVPAIGAVRRVQALMAIGWRKADLQAAGIPSAQLVTRPPPPHHRGRLAPGAAGLRPALHDPRTLTKPPGTGRPAVATPRPWPGMKDASTTPAQHPSSGNPAPRPRGWTRSPSPKQSPGSPTGSAIADRT